MIVSKVSVKFKDDGKSDNQAQYYRGDRKVK